MFQAVPIEIVCACVCVLLCSLGYTCRWQLEQLLLHVCFDFPSKENFTLLTSILFMFPILFFKCIVLLFCIYALLFCVKSHKESKSQSQGPVIPYWYSHVFEKSEWLLLSGDVQDRSFVLQLCVISCIASSAYG